MRYHISVKTVKFNCHTLCHSSLNTVLQTLLSQHTLPRYTLRTGTHMDLTGQGSILQGLLVATSVRPQTS